jgi:amidase
MVALAERTSWIRKWSLFLEDWPIVLCPTAFDPPMPQDVTGLTPEAYTRMFQAMMPSYVVPRLGLPGLAVPTGLSDGLPTGVQLIAGRFREDLVLDAAEAIEAAHQPITPINPR